jgi:hypothetical protein
MEQTYSTSCNSGALARATSNAQYVVPLDVSDLLGHVAIIVYGCLLYSNSLFQDVLKRSGTFEIVVELSKNWAVRPHEKIRIENPLLEVQLRVSDVAMHRALMWYYRTVPAPKL